MKRLGKGELPMRELNNRLRKGESLLWESAPKNFTMLEGKLYIKIIGQWIITVIFAIWLFYVERNRPEFGTGMKALVVAVAAAIILAPFVEYYNLKRQKYYRIRPGITWIMTRSMSAVSFAI